MIYLSLAGYLCCYQTYLTVNMASVQADQKNSPGVSAAQSGARIKAINLTCDARRFKGDRPQDQGSENSRIFRGCPD